jgi:hypothetical protein
MKSSDSKVKMIKYQTKKEKVHRTKYWVYIIKFCHILIRAKWKNTESSVYIYRFSSVLCEEIPKEGIQYKSYTKVVQNSVFHFDFKIYLHPKSLFIID